LAEKIQKHCSEFDSRAFIKAVATGTQNLERKDRVEFIADQLQAKLPADFKKGIKICRKV
jgi:hypothetical protein